MAIKKNKFEELANEIDMNENTEKSKSKKVIVGDNDKDTRVVVDKNGNTRRIKKAKEKKFITIGMPVDIYEKLDAITEYYCTSKNAAILEGIRWYLKNNKDVLDELDK